MSSFAIGSIDAFEDKLLKLPFDSFRQGYGRVDDLSEDYQDAYTGRWFPIADAPVTCGLRKDLPRKQRVHDYVSLGKDIKNAGEKGIVEVIVFACSLCGRDWRE